METTKNKLPPFAQSFFKKLSIYLDTPIYFYGSVQRNDYFLKYSDIDVDIFTNNENSLVNKIQNFLNISKQDFKKFVYKLHITKELVNGIKIKYEDIDNNFSTDISIYNKKYKESVLIEHNSKVQLPFIISTLIIILKFIYYQLNILPSEMYLSIKKFLMNFCVEGKDVEFVSIDIPKHEKE
jgi:hypothetical protein